MITGSLEDVRSKLASIELHLRIASESQLTSDAALHGIQIAFGDKFEKTLSDLNDQGLFSAFEYPAIAEALVATANARSITTFGMKDMGIAIDFMKA